jgi:2Fe-2S ferredoxin
MHKVTFQPLGTSVETEEGKSVLETALEHQIHLEHACGGFAACTTCHVIIEEGENNLSEMEELEEDMLDNVEGGTLRSRLGCQAKVSGDIVVQIPKTPY